MPANAKATSGAPRRRLLIVEDDQDQSLGLAQRLEHEGYEVVVASDAPGAIRAARLQRPDLILLDLGLPGGDGYLVMERLNAIVELATIPVLVLSGRDAMQERVRAMKWGAAAYFQKPVKNQALKAALQLALDE